MGNAEAAQEFLLFRRSGSREHLRTQVAGHLDGGQAHAAGRTGNEHAFPRFQARQLLQPVKRRQEHRGHGGQGRRVAARRHRQHGRGAGDDVGGKAAAGKTEHPVARSDGVHPIAHAHHPAGEFQAQGGAGKPLVQRFGRQQAQRQHHIAEVARGRLHRDIDVAGANRRGVFGPPRQPAQPGGGIEGQGVVRRRASRNPDRRPGGRIPHPVEPQGQRMVARHHHLELTAPGIAVAQIGQPWRQPVRRCGAGGAQAARVQFRMFVGQHPQEALNRRSQRMGGFRTFRCRRGAQHDQDGGPPPPGIADGVVHQH